MNKLTEWEEFISKLANSMEALDRNEIIIDEACNIVDENIDTIDDIEIQNFILNSIIEIDGFHGNYLEFLDFLKKHRRKRN